ncbi:LysR family transcriptional regulator [Limnohabitans sp.]|uniref:LysR family transcriptional regulator n=1 Tax=Limnohabitans sp. TaxID=1907725 RepID=UPI00286F02D1|nr:LysR family transcriptional regulator [Limnohabitans sp.]
MKNATFRQLRVFNTVAKNLSFLRAAEQLHLTPPAVTMQIKELEKHVGLPLFDRSGKKISLTTTGEYMLLYARKILATLKDAEDAVARLQHVETGILTIGMVSTAKYYLMRMLADFQVKHPGVDIRLTVGNREQLVKMLQANEVDIAVMGRPPKELQTRAEPFAAHPHVFVAAPQHPLAERKHIGVEELRGHDFIVREQGSGTRAAMEKFFTAAHVQATLKVQVQSSETLKQAVMAGLGLGFVSLHTIGSELAHHQIAVLDVVGTPVVRAWNVVHTQSKMLSPAAEAFRYEMLENGEAFLAQKFGQFLPVRA